MPNDGDLQNKNNGQGNGSGSLNGNNDVVRNVNGRPAGESGGRDFNEIDELARDGEIKTRQREKLHADKIEAETENSVSRGKAAQKTVRHEYLDVYRHFIAKYRNDPRLKNAVGASQDDEYSRLLSDAYKALFSEYGSAASVFEQHYNLKPSSRQAMENSVFSPGGNIPAMLSAFTAAEKNLEQALLYEESDRDPLVRELLTDIYDFHTSIERNSYGMLYVPHDKCAFDENGKFIHRVTQPKDDAGRWIQPEVSETKRGGHSNDELFVNFPDHPLFDHEPTETDIRQGNLGDCYFLAAVASTAAQAPELIKESMRFNPADNTVTVRFYNNNQEPVYVTVDNSVPAYYEHDVAANKDKLVRPTSRRAIWVALLEKAYAVSGLKNDKLAQAEKGTYRAKYEDIRSGQEKDAFSHLYGYETHPVHEVIGAFDRSLLYRQYDITMRNLDDVKCGQSGQPYTREENAVFMNLSDAFAMNHTLSTSLRPGLQAPKGLYTKHAFSLTGVEEDTKTGKKYVLIRNPHGTVGGDYDEECRLVPGSIGLSDGYSRIELRGFLTHFEQYTEARHDTSYLTRERQQELQETLGKYRKVVDFIHKAIEENDNGFLRTFGKNSPQFNAFRTSALRAFSQFHTSPYAPEAMKQSVKDMIAAAKGYQAYRENNRRAGYDNTAARSVNRYNMAVLVGLAEEAFNKMEAPGSRICRTVEPAELLKQMKQRGAVNDGAAATAAFGKLDNIEKSAKNGKFL